MTINIWRLHVFALSCFCLETRCITCMQASIGSEQAQAAGSVPTEADERKQHNLHIEDWVPQEGISMPEDTKGTLTERLDAALELLQVVSEKESLQKGPCLSTHTPLFTIAMQKGWAAAFMHIAMVRALGRCSMPDICMST